VILAPRVIDVPSLPLMVRLLLVLVYAGWQFGMHR
jgi:hypothetical protein